MDFALLKGKRVFLTGHTGFKGSWMSKFLVMQGFEVMGYALAPVSSPNLYDLAGIAPLLTNVIADIRDYNAVLRAMAGFRPEIVIHMAAQPLVRESYENPVQTYETNLMGTVHVLEAVRRCDSVRSVLNVTTDKVYQNREWFWGYRETDPLDGFDPYSNSKSCSELATNSYRNSFFSGGIPAVSTARAGNVIGGGDFAKDRIIPDCIRAVQAHEEITVRNPHSIRPYQHVLEPLAAYLRLALLQLEDARQYQGSYNIGPDEQDCVETGRLVDIFCKEWGDATWCGTMENNAPHEANFLRLDCSKAKSVLRWHPAWNIEQAVAKTVAWVKAYCSGENMAQFMEAQIKEYLNVVVPSARSDDGLQ